MSDSRIVALNPLFFPSQSTGNLANMAYLQFLIKNIILMRIYSFEICLKYKKLETAISHH